MEITKSIDELFSFHSSVKNKITELNDDIIEFVMESIDGELINYYPFDRFSSSLLLLQELEALKRRLEVLKTRASEIEEGEVLITLKDFKSRIEFIESQYVFLKHCFSCRKVDKKLHKKLSLIEFFIFTITKNSFNWNGLVSLGDSLFTSSFSQIISITPNYLEKIENIPIIGHEIGHIMIII